MDVTASRVNGLDVGARKWPWFGLVGEHRTVAKFERDLTVGRVGVDGEFRGGGSGRDGRTQGGLQSLLAAVGVVPYEPRPAARWLLLVGNGNAVLKLQ